MIAVCQQPNYFPWLGYLEQCARAEQLIILDSVQWIKRGWQHRAKILPHWGETEDFQWLTVPVRARGHREKSIKEMNINREEPWAKDHWNTIKAIYGKRPFFKSQVEPYLAPWFEKASQFETLKDATVSSMKLCFDILDLHPQIFFSSELRATGSKADFIISLCKAVNADVYYSGMGSASYLQGSTLHAAGIELIWQRWKYTEYLQGRGRFKSHLSFIDTLSNAPCDEIKSWIKVSPQDLLKK